MDEEFSLPQPFTGGSTALALPAPSVGSGLESMSSMSPMESMMEIFMEIRDGINTLVDLFQGQILGSADEARDLELAAADTDVTDPGPPAEEPAEGGSPTERKIFNKANLKKALLLGGIALLFTFTEQIEKALDEIRPFLQSDGGNIKLISFTETEVKVKLLGNCVNCTVNQMTLKNGVEMTIKKYVPQIEKVTRVE